LHLHWKNLSASSIVMMQAAQDREGNDFATCVMGWHGSSFRFRNQLLDALMRPGSVELVHIRVEHALELLLMEDQQMIEALTPDTAQEAPTDSIGSRGVIRRCEHLNATRLSYPRKAHPKLAVVVSNEILRSHAIGSGLPKLLRSPSVGRSSC